MWNAEVMQGVIMELMMNLQGCEHLLKGKCEVEIIVSLFVTSIYFMQAYKIIYTMLFII